MTRGLIARCGVRGGLTIQSAEAARHLAFDRILVVHTDHDSRGACDRDLYPGDHVTWLRGGPTPEDARTFMDGLDVVFSAECLYNPDWMGYARELGVDVVVQANPELYDALELAGARVVLPTTWEAHRVPHERILPVPIALDRFPYRQRSEARVFYHPTAPAMQDRNGTGIVLAALQYVTAEVTMIIRGQLSRGELARKATWRIPDNVTLVELPYVDGPYWEAYPPEADVLVLPRRYGGLSLSMQESAALGMPLITTDLEPQRAYPHALLVDASPSFTETMKIGDVMVFKADPRDVAAQMDRLATSPMRVAAASAFARTWAESLSWQQWTGAYDEVLAAR